MELHTTLISTSVVLLATAGLSWAQEKEIPSWAPKPEARTPYRPPHKPHTKLSEVRAKHNGKKEWRERVVDDDHITADYVYHQPGFRIGRRFHSDTREWWVILDGEVRFKIEGQDDVLAKKGGMVQVPAQTIFNYEVLGNKPALLFDVNIARAHYLYPQDVKPPDTPGVEWLPVTLRRSPFPYGHDNKPMINLYEIAKKVINEGKGTGMTRFIHDDRAVSNAIYGFENSLPPLNPKNRGHYHPECAEFWLVMAGQIRYPVEGQGVIIAGEGDVVYVPPFTFHAPRFHGDQFACRLAINGYPNIAHLFDSALPH